jgi:uncharacterized FlaG/YvyC family protein
MSSDFSIRPVGAPVSATVVAPTSQSVSGAVQTDLPPSQTVTAADSSASVRSDSEELAANNAFVAHQAYYDRTAAAMVFQVVNRKTEEVVEQYPDEAVLRRRAYFHALDMQKDDVPRVLPTDRTA